MFAPSREFAHPHPTTRCPDVRPSRCPLFLPAGAAPGVRRRVQRAGGPQGLPRLRGGGGSAHGPGHRQGVGPMAPAAAGRLHLEIEATYARVPCDSSPTGSQPCVSRVPALPIRLQAKLQALSYGSPLELLRDVNLVRRRWLGLAGLTSQVAWRQGRPLARCPLAQLSLLLVNTVLSATSFCTIPALHTDPLPTPLNRSGPTARPTTPTAPTSWPSATTAAVPLRRPGGWRACLAMPPPGSQPRRLSCGRMRPAAWRHCPLSSGQP